MADTSLVRVGPEVYKTAGAAIAVGELHQLPDGRAAYYDATAAAASGAQVKMQSVGQVVVPKTALIAILDGGRVYWDFSENKGHFKKVNDRDFYIGRAVGDAAEADTTVTVNLNVDPPYTIDISEDAFTTAIVGTQALGGLALNRRGGAHNFVISATNEAQKIDILSFDSFHKNSNPVIEFAFNVVDDGSGTVVDVSIGAASGTHATDASSIAQRLFMHLDANDVDINFESADGTTTVAITDSTVNYTLGTRHEVWIDMRDPTLLKIYVDGVRVLSATTFTINDAASEWKLLAHVEKTASTDTYEFDLHLLRVRTQE